MRTASGKAGPRVYGSMSPPKPERVNWELEKRTDENWCQMLESMQTCGEWMRLWKNDRFWVSDVALWGSMRLFERFWKVLRASQKLSKSQIAAKSSILVGSSRFARSSAPKCHSSWVLHVWPHPQSTTQNLKFAKKPAHTLQLHQPLYCLWCPARSAHVVLTSIQLDGPSGIGR